MLMGCGQTPPPYLETLNHLRESNPAIDDLAEYADRVINNSAAKLPQYYRDHVQLVVVEVANEILSNPQHRRYWIALIAAESAFRREAQSPKGAIGLGQLLPQFAGDFGKACGVTDVRTSDLWDMRINAWLSACYFNDLIKKQGGIVTYALIAYNAGPNSRDLKAAKNGQRVSSEPANYVKEINRIKEIGERND
jgi:hypothetical protein